MKRPGNERAVELGGIEYDIVFASEVNDAQRIQLDLPARGVRCECIKCICRNDADAGSAEHPICGCCMADCPDVHPDEDANQ